MISVYEKDDYREIFQAILEQAKQKQHGHSLAQIAKDCGIQPSYLTNVIKYRCHFSADQASDILSYLGYNAEDIDFVILLIDFERSGSIKRKQALKDKIQKVRRTKLRADHYIVAEQKNAEVANPLLSYYLDPLAPILHMYFGIRTADQNPKAIAAKFRVSEDRILKIIDFLKQERFLELKHGKYKQTALQLHLPKDSPLAKAHQILMRTLSLERLARVEVENHFSFSVTFNADENARTKIHVEFLKFIKKCQNLCRESKSENILQMNFDLFPWDL